MLKINLFEILKNLWPLWTAIGVIVIVGTVFEIYRSKNKAKEEQKPIYQYRRKDFFMSRAEHQFFDILASALGNQYYIFAQVHLSTILDNKVIGQYFDGAWRHIHPKSVDFVICDKTYIRPLLAIELDDGSHTQTGRQERDSEVERIFQGAGLPLLRFRNEAQFHKDEIIEKIVASLSSVSNSREG